MIATFVIAALWISFMPIIYRVNYAYDGWQIDIDDAEYAEPATIKFEGEIYRYLFKDDYFIGKVQVSGYRLVNQMQYWYDPDANIEFNNFIIPLESGSMWYSAKSMCFLRMNDYQIGSYYGNNKLDNVIFGLLKNIEDNHYVSCGRYLVAPAANRVEATKKVNELLKKFRKEYIKAVSY